MRKLLQINIAVGGGSTANIAEQIGRMAIDRGWESWIAYSAKFGHRKSASNLIEIGSTFDFYEHAIESRLFDNHGLASRRATKELLRKIDEVKPDIIHLHNIHGYYVNYKLLFKYINDNHIPVVWTFHDCWPFTGHCTHFISVNCLKWKTKCSHCPLKSEYPQSLLLDRSKRNFVLKKNIFTSVEKMVITTVSNWLTEVVCESFFSDQCVQTVYNGIDMSIFQENTGNLRERLGYEDKFIILGVAKKWDDGKGLGDFIKLSKQVSSDTIIILIGVDDEVKKLLPDNIIPIKRTANQAELVEFYSSANVTLNISYAETFGLPTVEAMACGTPAIVYDNTAIPEPVTKETGIIVKTGDISAILKGIDEIKSKGKDYYRLACIEHAKRLYDKELNFQKFFDIYNELLK